MEKMEIGAERAYYPMPCSLVGVNVKGRPNYLTVAWFSMVNPKPACVMVALNKAHYSNAGIRENGTFETFYGKLETAPMIKECPFNVECKLVQTVDLPVDELFIGEIVAAYSDARFLTDGVPDLRKINPFVLAMPERKYLGLGDEVGPAWEMGKKLIKKGT
jgi:flavin reductase (DIM6/NTAB) family NADH-FMN oxidoreductase RutF